MAGESSRSGPATLAGKMARAATWSSLGSVAMRLGSFSVGIVAARLIAPEQFGVFAVALTVHAIIVSASDLGVSAYVVRHDGDLSKVGPTVTTIAAVSAALLAGAMALSAPWLSSELGAGDATGPVQVLSLTVLLAGISSVPSGMLTREFRQDKRFLADVANFAVSTAVLLVLALSGGGALALAWSRVAGQGISTVLLFAMSPQRWLPGLDLSVVRSVASFGVPLVGAAFLGFLIGNIDFIVVGRILGAEPLGFYYLAYNAGSWPYVILAPIVASVTVAAFARVRHDRAALKGRVATSMSALLLIALPANALIAVLGTPLIHVVYGSRWSPAAAALALTALYGALRVPADLLFNIAIAEGRTRALFVLQIAYLAALTPLTVVCVHAWGIAGAGVAHIIAIAAVLIPGLVLMLARVTGFGFAALLSAAARPAGASAAAALAASLVSGSTGSAWLALLGGGAAGVAVYLALVAAWGRGIALAVRRVWSEDAPAEPAPELRTLAPRPEGAHA